MSDRPSWTDHWFAHADLTRERATCNRLMVGAVIVDRHNRLVGSGYNGSPAGLPHCTEVGCLKDAHGRCKRCVHAELNALLSTSPAERAGGSMYVSHQPCPECTVVLLNSGLAAVYYRHEYAHPNELRLPLHAMARQSGLRLVWVPEGSEA